MRLTQCIEIGLLATILLGCAAANDGEQTEESVATSESALYLLGSPWPNGVVDVCFDGNDGNNPALLATARNVLAHSWSQAANIQFNGWGQCNYLPSTVPRSMVAIHFTNRGFAHARGRVQATSVNPLFCGGRSPCFTPGVTSIELISNDTVGFQQSYRYVVIHEFGHALGFAHEQERPDNWTAAGTPIFCGATDGPTKALTGGTYLTPMFDYDSIMDYCSSEKLVGGAPTRLSAGDVFGARVQYSRNNAAHGFMIQSDTNPGLAVNATNGAAEGTVLTLQSGCTISNPDCTWSYQYGMLVSDRNPRLAVIAAGAAHGRALTLTTSCTMTNPECLWTYKNGEFLSEANNGLAINASGGAQQGTTLKLDSTCTPNNPDCTFTMQNLMLSSARNSTLGINAFGGANFGTALKLHNACTASNPDCTWTFSRGMLISSTNSTLAMNAFGGAANGIAVRLHNGCTISNPDCTWTWRRGELVSDTSPASHFTMNAALGALHLADIKLDSVCTSGNADCVFNSYFARN